MTKANDTCIVNQYLPYITSPAFTGSENQNKTAEGIFKECAVTQSIRISGYLMIVLCVMILVPLLFITMRVKQLVWKRDKILVFMLVFLCSSVIMFIVYFTFLVYSEYHLVWQNNQQS